MEKVEHLVIPSKSSAAATTQVEHDEFRRPNIPQIRRRFFQRRCDSKRLVQFDRHDLVKNEFLSVIDMTGPD